MGIELYNKIAHECNAFISEKLKQKLGIDRDPYKEYQIIKELNKQKPVNYKSWSGTSQIERLLQQNIEEFYCPKGGLRGEQKETVKQKLYQLIYKWTFIDPDQAEQLINLYQFLDNNEAIFRY